MARRDRQRLRDEIHDARRLPFFIATVTATDQTAHTITVTDESDTFIFPASMGVYPAVGSLVFVNMNGDEPVVAGVLGDSGGFLGGGSGGADPLYRYVTCL